MIGVRESVIGRHMGTEALLGLLLMVMMLLIMAVVGWGRMLLLHRLTWLGIQNGFQDSGIGRVLFCHEEAG